MLAVTVLCAAAGGFFAAVPFWQREDGPPGEPQGGGQAATFVRDESFNAPAFLPEATADDLKEEATRTAEGLLAAYPTDTNSYAAAARLQYSLGHLDAAVSTWQRSLEIDPRFVDAYFGMGVIAKDGGDFLRAAEMFERVMLLAPAEPQTPPLLADVLMSLDRVDEAVVILDRHVHAQPTSANAVVTLGQAYLQLQNYEKAKQAYEVLIETDPNDPRAYYGLARAYTKLGQKEKARPCLEKFRELASIDQEDLVRRNRAYADVAWVRGILARTLLETGQMYRRHGRPAVAETMWRKAALLEAEDSTCRRELLSLYGKQGRDEDALRVAEELCKIEPEAPDHWFNVGLFNGRLERFEPAQAAIERAIQLDPENPRYRQAQVLLQNGR